MLGRTSLLFGVTRDTAVLGTSLVLAPLLKLSYALVFTVDVDLGVFVTCIQTLAVVITYTGSSDGHNVTL